MSNDKDETRKVKTSDLNKKSKSKKGTKKNKVKFKDKHPKIALTIKITLIVLMLVIIIGAGVLVGTLYGVFGDELKIDESMLKVGYENSTVYDADGNQIAILSGGTKRKSISLSEMSEYLPKAYVSIEDERFYKHSGIDIGRTAYATFNYIIHAGKSSFGGSTITQQVIKNITQDKEKTALAGVVRKVKEISKAIQVERYLSKDQILELYLNLIFVGGDDINGVELGSVYYFNKSAKDLSIAECAYLAGINNSPNAYKPFEDFSDKEDPEKEKQKMTDKINKRTKTVLAKMKEHEAISEEQFNEAVAEVDNGLHFQKGESASVTTDVSYVTEAAIDQILNQIMEENADNEDMDRKMAEMYLYSSGLKIYTTQKSDIQKIVEEELVKDVYTKEKEVKEKNKETNKVETVIKDAVPTMVIEDYRTGQIVAAATATGKKDERTATTKLGYLNIPTEIKKQTGSSMKPISVIAPGLETGKITGATVYYNLITSWGTGNNAWSPKNSTGYSTYSNMRTAIEQSYNIPHAKALTDIGTEAAVEFCKSIGLPDFTPERVNLALGGLNDGISPADMASAYSAIANDGVYITPTFYTKVTDKQGNVLYEPKQEENRVMSEQNAYIEKDILKQPVISGTATYCAIKGMDVAAKTGTTNDDLDRWLCGFTPYYAAACWYGYETKVPVTGFGRNPAGTIWDNIITEIHKDLDGKTFEEPDGIIKKAVCKISGKLPSETCTEVYTELFTESSVPTEVCEGHGVVGICNDSQQLATPNCPSVTQLVGYIPERERNAIWHTEGVLQVPPTGTCPLHQAPAAPAEPVPTPPPTPEQHTHTPGNWIVDTPATATTAGSKHQVCSTCGATIKVETIPATGGSKPPTNTVEPKPDPTPPTNTVDPTPDPKPDPVPDPKPDPNPPINTTN